MRTGLPSNPSPPPSASRPHRLEILFVEERAQLINMDISNGIPGLADACGAPPNYIENNREYHGYSRGLYMYPCDENEKDRMDIYHHIFLVARWLRHGKVLLHKVPVAENARILDLGTGTGIWTMQMSDLYPNAQIWGIDLVNIQPPLIPPNVHFVVPQNYENSWQLGHEPWDFIHFRMGCGSVSNWEAMYEKIFTHLRPGGWLEHIEIDIRPQYEQDADRCLKLDEWYGYLEGATRMTEKRLEYPQNLRELMSNCGFVDIDEEVFRLPLNEWPDDEPQKFMGRWYNFGLRQGLEALMLGPLTRAYEWPSAHVDRLLASVKPLISSRRTRAYNEIGTILGGFLNLSSFFFCCRRVISNNQKLLQNYTHLFDRTLRLAPLGHWSLGTQVNYLTQHKLRLPRSWSERTGHINSLDSVVLLKFASLIRPYSNQSLNLNIGQRVFSFGIRIVLTLHKKV